MKRAVVILLGLVLIVALSPPILGNEDQESADHQLIEATALDYVEGWYAGDSERMQRAMHPDLAKRKQDVLPTGECVMRTLSANSMIEYTRAGGGSREKDEIRNAPAEITIFAISEVTASAVVISAQYIDYLHLVKCGDQWQIVNVLWEPNNSK